MLFCPVKNLFRSTFGSIGKPLVWVKHRDIAHIFWSCRSSTGLGQVGDFHVLKGCDYEHGGTNGLGGVILRYGSRVSEKGLMKSNRFLGQTRSMPGRHSSKSGNRCF